MLNLRNKSEYWNETFHLALQALWSNKLRAGLTMLVVIIGSGCIVLVVTVALVGKRYIITQIEGVGSNLVYAGFTHSSKPSRLTLSDEISLLPFPIVINLVLRVMPEAIVFAFQCRGFRWCWHLWCRAQADFYSGTCRRIGRPGCIQRNRSDMNEEEGTAFLRCSRFSVETGDLDASAMARS
jgi:hypothetical protein